MGYDEARTRLEALLRAKAAGDTTASTKLAPFYNALSHTCFGWSEGVEDRPFTYAMNDNA